MKVRSFLALPILLLLALASPPFVSEETCEVCRKPRRSIHLVTQGNVYYVDPVGSDSNPGTRQAPWRTIQHAAGRVRAGDTVLINPGVYNGGIRLSTSGMETSPITFRANLTTSGHSRLTWMNLNLNWSSSVFIKGSSVIIEGSGGERDAFFITEANYIILEGLTIQHATRAGLRISWSHHVSVRRCLFADNGRWGIFTDFSDYTLIEDCESYGARLEHGIYISNSSDYPIIRRNRLHHNYACGLHMNGDISMGGDGIISHGLVECNMIYANGVAGGSAINMDGVTDTIVRNNLLYDNHASGISVFQIDGGSGSQNNRLLNNTIIMPADGRWAINIPETSDTGNKVFNNILFSYHPWRGGILIAEPHLAGFESDYNIVVSRFSVDGGDSVIGLDAWRALGYDRHSIIATPEQLFVNPAARDYHLKPGSPAIDAGIALPDVTSDLDGRPRPWGPAFDIGAYEWWPLFRKVCLPVVGR